MDAFNRYHKCFHSYIRKLLQIIGHDYFLPNYKRGPLAYIMYSVLVTFLLTNMYTIFYYEPFTVFNAIIFMCLALEVSITTHFGFQLNDK